MASDQWFVDADNGDDTGAGTAADPFLTLDKVFTAKTIGTNGTSIMLKTGTTTEYVVPSGGLSTSTFGAPASTQPLTIIGWDGGTAASDAYKLLTTRAVIDVASDKLFATTNLVNTRFINLTIYGDGTNTLNDSGTPVLYYNCEFYHTTDSANDLIETAAGSVVAHCYFHDFGSYGLNTAGNVGGVCYRSLFVDETGDHGTRTAYCYIYCPQYVGENVLVSNGGTGRPSGMFIRPRYSGLIVNNAVFHSGGFTQTVILPVATSSDQFIVHDNVFAGMSGTGCEIFDASTDVYVSYAGNVIGDDTTADITTGSAVDTIITVSSTEEAAPLWRNAGTLDFTPEDIDSIRQGTYFPKVGGHAGGITSDTYNWKGAIQPKEKLPFHGAAGSLDGI